jgi:MFS family permease
VQSTFFVYGVIFAVLVLLGSTVMRNPPDDYSPEGWVPPTPSNNKNNGATDMSSGEMLRTPQFYTLWTVFMCSALAGLMVIYCIKLFGIDALQHQGVLNAGAITGTAMAWYAIFNGIGRIAWGSVSDWIGRRNAIMLMTFSQGMVMLMTYHVFITFGSAQGFIMAAALIGFNFGGNFALFPAATADYFGNRNVGTNYGWVFTAYGVAGIAGPLLAGYFKDAAAGAALPAVWMTPFIIAGAACLVATAIVAFSERPSRARQLIMQDT